MEESLELEESKKSIILVDKITKILAYNAKKQGFGVRILSDGQSWGHAEEFVKHDIILFEATQENAEKLRIMMNCYTIKKNTIICRFGWNNYWFNKGGEYQLTTVNKSFSDSEIFESSSPNFAAFAAAVNKYNTLNGSTLEINTKNEEVGKIKAK